MIWVEVPTASDFLDIWIVVESGKVYRAQPSDCFSMNANSTVPFREGGDGAA